METGEAHAILDPVILCEVAYMLVTPTCVPHAAPPRTATEVAEHLLSVVEWAGAQVVERDTVLAALEAWRHGPCDDLVDAYLQAKVAANGEPVCAVNRRDFPHSVPRAAVLGRPAPPRRARSRRTRP